MKEKTLVLYHEDKRYAYRFTDYLQRHVRFPLRVKCFAEKEEMRLYVTENQPDLLLTDAPEEGLEGKFGTFVFSETPRPEDPAAIYRYRPMEKNVRQLLRGIENRPEKTPGRETQIWGFYSPVRGAGQTAAALLAGQQLAEQDTVLYLNLEQFSGLGRLLGGESEGSLSDLLYYVRVQEKPAARLPELTEHLGNLCYVQPAAGREDVPAASREDWEKLLQALKESGIYHYVILDIGEGPADPLVLLEQCSRIFTAVRSDKISGAKEAEWRSFLEESGREEILGRIRRFILPEPEEKGEFLDYRRLRFTAWGRFVKQLLLEEDL